MMNNFFVENNRELQHKVESFFLKLSEANLEKFGGQLSVILLGSLSRGEATWISRNGQTKLLSDIEFFTIYPKKFKDFSEFDRIIQEAACDMLEDVKSDLFHIDNTWIEVRKLKNMERKLLTFDAQECGLIVVGPNVLNKLPRITLENINLEDIEDILIHRVFSLMYYGVKAKECGALDEYRYLLAKNSLDLMTVLLVNYGILVSGFSNKLSKIREIGLDKSLEQYFSYCLSIKQSRDTDDFYEIDEMERIFIELIDGLHNEFAIPIQNRLRNAKAILRRHLGIIKRGIQVRMIAPSRKAYLSELSESFKQNAKLSKQQLLFNYILNGYPKPEKTDRGIFE